MENSPAHNITVAAILLYLFSFGSSEHSTDVSNSTLSPVRNEDVMSDNQTTVDGEGNAAVKDTHNSCFHVWNELKKLHIVKYQSSSSSNCSRKVDVLRCYCLTAATDSSTSTATAVMHYGIGHCLYGCFKTNYVDTEYLTVDFSDLQNGVCANFSREGLLCGQCIANYSPPVYSFTLRCVECQNTTLWKRILLYITVAYGPLTVFLLLIIVFTISVNTAPLHGWIFVCQVIAAPNHMRVITTSGENRSIPKYPLNVFGTIYGIWNLDFFRSLYPPFCLHSSLNTLQVISLDYLIAAYPIIIIVLMYILVDLHSHDCRLIVVIWKPFRYCFARFRHNLNIRTSLVDAFGTFFTLSYVKMLSTTSDIIAYSEVWTNSDKVTHNVYFDGTMHFFKGRHITFAIVGTFTLLVCNVLPLGLILVYSFRRTQLLLHCLPTSVKNALHPFMDNLLGCYKDGTNGTRNCRYFAAVYHIARIALFVCFAAFKSPYYGPISLYIFIITALLVLILQPYKSAVYNILDASLFLTLALVVVGLSAYLTGEKDEPSTVKYSEYTGFFTVSTPVLFMAGYFCYKKCFSERLLNRCLKNKIQPLVLSLLRHAHIGRDRNAEMANVSEKALLIQ